MRLGLEAGTQTLELAVELGVSGVPINADQLVDGNFEAALAPLHERNLSVCQIGAFGFNPLCLDPIQKQLLADVIPLAAETGCPYIVINGGNYHPSGFLAADPRNFTEAALDEVARVLEPFLKQTEKYGAKLSIEAYLKTAICTPERFLALREKAGSEALVVNVDVTSLYGFWELVNPSDSVAHACHALAGHYGLVHLKEISLSEGFHLQAGLVPLGKGATDWGQVLSLIEPSIPGDSWVILEHVATPEEARSSISFIRQVAKNAGITLE